MSAHLTAVVIGLFSRVAPVKYIPQSWAIYMTRNCEPPALAVTPSEVRNLPENKAQRGPRKWEVFPGKNRFCCDGRIMLAKESSLLPVTLGVIVVTSALFFIFDCPYLMQRVSVFIPVISALLFVFVLFCLLRTSFTDPGILPRAKHPAADLEKQIGSPELSPPRTKEIIINQQVVKLKYCSTCKIIRPPRTSHCSQCDNCVERFDHHCPWVGNCVGKRNYRFFFCFLTSLALLISFILACVITHITLRSLESSLVQAIEENPASVVEIIICHFAIGFILGLLAYHTYLLASNLTTKEDGAWSRRKGARSPRNPYSSDNICSNCIVTLCGPMPPSVIDRRGFISADELVSPAASDQDVLTVRRDTRVVDMGR